MHGTVAVAFAVAVFAAIGFADGVVQSMNGGPVAMLDVPATIPAVDDDRRRPA